MDQTEVKISRKKKLGLILKSKFFLSFMLILILTSAAVALRTFQNQSQINPQPLKNVPTRQELIRRSKIPKIITKATTARIVDVKSGKVIQAARVFSVNEKTIFLALDLDNPAINTRIDYIRYLNGRYVDHGSIKIGKANTQNLVFSWAIGSVSGGRPDGKYKVATYTNGVLEKRLSYTVTKNKVVSSIFDSNIEDTDYQLTPTLLSDAF